MNEYEKRYYQLLDIHLKALIEHIDSFEHLEIADSEARGDALSLRTYLAEHVL